MAAFAPSAAPPVPQPWTALQRLLFRVVFCYLVLYISPGNLWHSLVPWLAIHVFHLSGQAVTYFPTGSGDTTLSYIEDLFFLVSAALAALVWSVLDRRRPDYRVLHAWLRLLVRYALASIMFSYGFAKIFPMQFPAPRLTALIETYGEFSPMGVLWRFMGVSAAYTIFAGAAEATGAALLLFRRTTTLGALVLFAVLTNVVLLNFCYDVPVKLYSSNLLLMSVFLLAPDLRRLANCLILNRPAEPADLSQPGFERRWLRLSALALKILVAGAMVVGHTLTSMRYYAQISHPQRSPLYGIYDVEQFARNGRDQPPLTTSSTLWRHAVFENLDTVAVRTMSGSPLYYRVSYNVPRATLTLSPGEGHFTYSRPDAGHLLLEGSFGADAVSVRLRRIDLPEFPLLNRGFHWINEYPFNR